MSTTGASMPVSCTPGRRRRVSLLAGAGVLATLVVVPFAGSAAADVGGSASHPSARNSGLIPGTPCHYGTSACVQLGHQGYNARSWFIKDDRVERGPVSSATGGPGKDTPTGSWNVTSKDVNHFSTETTNAEGKPSPMPYSVFFGGSGLAFHGGGDPKARTAGCVRLANSDASYFFKNLSDGDRVEVVDSGADVAGNGRHRDNDNDKDSGGGILGGL